MADLYHVVLKDHENSGYVWDEFFCPTCLDKWVTKSDHLEILCQTMAGPQYLSRVYPPLATNPTAASAASSLPTDSSQSQGPAW